MYNPNDNMSDSSRKSKVLPVSLPLPSLSTRLLFLPCIRNLPLLLLLPAKVPLPGAPSLCPLLLPQLDGVFWSREGTKL